MHIKAVLFDLDGTLLPIDQDEFVSVYFKGLAKALCPMGIEADALINAVWAGTGAMVKNDGSCQNAERFWDTFVKLTGMDESKVRPVADAFYGNEFNKAKAVAKENPMAKTAVKLAGQNGRKVVLATNPIFPMVAQAARLGWIGLDKSDFELITSYETETFSKPNPKYYLEICKRIGCAPEECLMIGNDDNEDMYPAQSIGMNCYLLTDCRIANHDNPWHGQSGCFAELVVFLKNL